ncbi:reverse transcriptase domain-containing protein [Tanacetum coccineum]
MVYGSNNTREERRFSFFETRNAPATFQRCMLAIFHDMIEESVKVFMDDFSIYGNSFDNCLNNLDKMLQRCKDAHLVLNWEKCHFMVKEITVLGHRVSEAGLEVDKAKIDVISQLLSPQISKLEQSYVKKMVKTFTQSTLQAKLLMQLNRTIQSLKKNLWLYRRIENEETSDDSEVNDNFPRETLMEINTEDEPWFADFANYLVSDIIPKGMMYQQKNNFFSDLKHYFWEHIESMRSYFKSMEVLIKTLLMPLSNKTILDNHCFVHELKREMHEDLEYVKSLEKEIDELESEKANFSNIYDLLLEECVSKDVTCSYLHSLSDLIANTELQCLYLCGSSSGEWIFAAYKG